MPELGKQLTSEQWDEFCRSIKEAGIKTDPWWEAVPYSGPPRVLQAGLFRKNGWCSRELIAAGSNLEGIETLAYYISGNLECKSWKLLCKTGRWQLNRGDFAIIQRSGFRGGNRQMVIDLLRSFGVEETLIDHTLNEQTEEVLGYMPSSTEEAASAIAQIVGQGAITPISSDEMVAFSKELADATGISELSQAKVVKDRVIIPASAETYYANGRYELAEEAFKERLRLNPEDVTAQNGLGLTYAQLGDYEKALPIFQSAIEINPQSGAAFTNLGTIYDSMGRYDESVAAHRKAVQLCPDDAEAHFSLAVALCHINYDQEAITSFENAVRLKSDYAEAYYGLGLTYSGLKNHDKAVSALKQAILMSPEFVAAHFHLGTQYLLHGDKDMAMQEYEALRQLGSDSADKLLDWIENWTPDSEIAHT